MKGFQMQSLKRPQAMISDRMSTVLLYAALLCVGGMSAIMLPLATLAH